MNSIIIKYNNNISGKIKLFSKKFILNNEGKFQIEIENKIINLEEELYEFKTKEEIVIVKLILNKDVKEINMYKMFSNCITIFLI